jgi:hypothetical protein
MKVFLTVFAILAVFLMAAGCSDDPAAPEPAPNDVTKGNELGTKAFQDLQDLVVSLQDMSVEELRNVSFATVQSGFNKALAADADNPIANLGLAILDILKLNYDEDIWGLFDDLDEYLNGTSEGAPSPAARHHTLFGRQFSLVVEIPLAMTVMRGTEFPASVTIGNIQQIVEDKVIPALRRSIGRLAIVEGHTNPVIRIQIEDEGITEWIKIDKGEIYLFSASVRALAAAFGMAIAYDMDLLGPDGTYGWIDDLRALHEFVYDHGSPLDSSYGRWSEPPCPIVELTDDTLEGIFGYNYQVALEDSLVLAIGYHNFENRPAFLTLQNDVLGQAHQDLLAMIDKLDAAVDFIRNHRQDENEENLIKLTDLTDFDSEIPGEFNEFNFSKDFAKAEDVTAFARGLLSGPYTFNEKIGPADQDFTWQMNFSALFNNPPDDLKTKLPLHKWSLPQQGSWLTYVDTEPCDVFSVVGTEDTSATVWAWHGVTCVEREYTGLEWVRTCTREYSFPVEDYVGLTDEAGQAIESNELPYLPDYTFNGFLPGWDRPKWQELKDKI